MSTIQKLSVSSSVQPDSFSSVNFRRQLLQRRGVFGVSTPAAQFNQTNFFQQSGQMHRVLPKSINGLPAEQWHSMSDERRRIFMQEKRKNAAFKTEMCKGYTEKGFCDFGIGCRFAHSQNELRLRPVHPKFKSELCRNYAIHGSCVYGSRCQFIHRSPVKGSQPQHQLYSSAPCSNQPQHHFYSTAPSKHLFSSSLQQQLQSQFSGLGVSGAYSKTVVPEQSMSPQSSSSQQMPSCVVCSGKECA